MGLRTARGRGDKGGDNKAVILFYLVIREGEHETDAGSGVGGHVKRREKGGGWPVWRLVGSS